jgi:hypothetical protein
MKKALGLLAPLVLLSTAAHAECIRPSKPARQFNDQLRIFKSRNPQ